MFKEYLSYYIFSFYLCIRINFKVFVYEEINRSFVFWRSVIRDIELCPSEQYECCPEC